MWDSLILETAPKSLRQLFRSFYPQSFWHYNFLVFIWCQFTFTCVKTRHTLKHPRISYSFQKRYPNILIIRLLILLFVTLNESTEKFSLITWKYERESQKTNVTMGYWKMWSWKSSLHLTPTFLSQLTSTGLSFFIYKMRKTRLRESLCPLSALIFFDFIILWLLHSTISSTSPTAVPYQCRARQNLIFTLQ